MIRNLSLLNLLVLLPVTLIACDRPQPDRHACSPLPRQRLLLHRLRTRQLPVNSQRLLQADKRARQLDVPRAHVQ